MALNPTQPTKDHPYPAGSDRAMGRPRRTFRAMTPTRYAVRRNQVKWRAASCQGSSRLLPEPGLEQAPARGRVDVGPGVEVTRGPEKTGKEDHGPLERSPFSEGPEARRRGLSGGRLAGHGDGAGVTHGSTSLAPV